MFTSHDRLMINDCLFFIGSVELLNKYKNILVNISWQKGFSAKTVEGRLGMPQGPRGTGPDYLANGPFNFCSLIQYFPGRGLISHIHPGLVHGIEQEAIQSRSGVDRVPTWLEASSKSKWAGWWNLTTDKVEQSQQLSLIQTFFARLEFLIQCNALFKTDQRPIQQLFQNTVNSPDT